MFSCLHKLIWTRDSVGRIRDSPLRDSLPQSIFVTKSKSQRSLLETTILEIKANIALHSDFKFEKVSPTIKQMEICQNVCCTFRVERSVRANSQVVLACKKNSLYDACDDLMENARPKRRQQVPTHTEAHNKLETKSTVCTENVPEFFLTLWSLCHAFKTQENVYRSVLLIIPLKPFLTHFY